MEKPILINSNEILLVHSVYFDRDEHIAESGPLDASQILSIVNGVDDVIQIFRINPSENSCEDISEEIADAYVEENIKHLYEESKVHYFIRESDTYNDLLDDLAKERYNDEVYGTYEQQHRLTPWDVLPNYPSYTSRF
ncbi:hypothetical protein MNL01_03795 [Bartonella krasnovii]|uniref:Acetyltransferase n=1 Tax=Bartonella krasnovii TaxID=2267275 RepID=A0A5B9D0N6_9HYPH|nr:hypothetical protein [Bartonella krasnovii]QEE12133.1 acetyltransferase [Bartonella krasnovii]UNF37687.1 hypothetical protein MNL11_02800 [Bartonella krasnovii]UNF42945.1 hypothetical protein MNL08_03720 [Bartonella krasnovii]UNF54453.1 hypothetical protein MNL01_03795 [Bartonella krasnovii]UNF56156.1 hypothetical protein MNL00_03730 [Bartonella krasnovii]